MFKKKPSFFEKLTGSVHVDDADEYEFEDEFESEAHTGRLRDKMQNTHDGDSKKSLAHASLSEMEENSDDIGGELTVDVIETQDSVIVRAMIAGVDPDLVDIDLSRDTVTIKGERKEAHRFSEDEYHYQELYWGSFTRTILLPAEVEVEEAHAHTDHGLLSITLPKIDKHRKTKLRISKK